MMLKQNEKALVARELARFFKTFQSSRTIEPEAQIYFIEDVAEFSFEAVMEGIARFRKGLVPERNDDFAPSVATFVKEVRSCQVAIDALAALAARGGETYHVVAYPIGGKPPPGYVSLGEFEERRHKRALDATEKHGAVGFKPKLPGSGVKK